MPWQLKTSEPRSTLPLLLLSAKTTVKSKASAYVAAFKGLKERPLKRPLGLYRGFMRLYKGYIRVI